MRSGTAETRFSKRLGRMFTRHVALLVSLIVVFLAVGYYRAEQTVFSALRTTMASVRHSAVKERVADAARDSRYYFAGVVLMLVTLGFIVSRGRRRLEAAGDEMEGLVGRVLHDMSRSLSTINVEAVNAMSGESDARSVVTRVESISRAEAKKIADYLQLARGFSGFDRASRERVNLSAAVCRISSDFAMNERDVEIKCSVPPEDVYVCAHRTLVSEIVGNLVDNAVKYTEKGTVSVTVSTKGGRVVLTVADTGRGIPKEDLKRVFRRFYRAGNVSGVPGTGLGLATVHELVTRLYRGRIAVRSVLGEGTTFTVTLPCAAAR